MSTSTANDDQGDADLKGKEFDEVCDIIKNDEVAGSVNKRPDGGGAGRWSHCFSFGPSEYSEAELLDLIAAEYGPGTYPVQFKSAAKGKRPVIRWHKDMLVQARRLGAQVSAPTAQSAPAANPTGLEALASILDNQARILERISEAIAKPPPAVKTTIDFVHELGAIKDLFSDNRQGALEQFKDAMELRKLIKDDDTNGDDPLSIAVRALTPAIERGVAALQESEATPTRPQVVPEGKGAPDVELNTTEPRAATPPLPETDAAIYYAYQLFGEQYLPALLQLAENGDDPEGVANYLVRLIGDDAKTIDLVGLVIAQDDMVLRFSKVNSRVLQFTVWLDTVADWLAHALWPATNPAPGPTGATRSATNDDAGRGGGISTDDAAGDQQADATATERLSPDAKPNPDAPATGDDNDP